MTAACGADDGSSSPQLLDDGTGSSTGDPTNGAPLPGDPQDSTAGDLPPPPPTSPAPGRDPSISFSWPEADLTSATGQPCKAGRYVGVFEGTYTSGATFIGISLPVSGNIDFTLLESQNGEFFEISNGRVIGVANAVTTGIPDPNMAGSGIPFAADIVGRLNCAQGTLELAGLQNGQYDVLGVLYFFEGPVGGDYDRATSSFFNGVWSVVEPAAPQFGGNGTWSATWTP